MSHSEIRLLAQGPLEREEDGKLVWRSAKVCTACR